MNSQESLKLAGRLNIVVTGEDGTVKDSREVNNLVVQGGLRWITSRMEGTSVGVMTHMGIGNDGTAAADGDTDLIGANKLRKAFTTATVANTPTPAAGRGTIVYKCEFAPADNITGGDIREAGVFTAATAGTMLCRTAFPVVNKGANDTMTITWTITLDAV